MVFVGVPETIAAAFNAHLAAEGVRPYGAAEGVRSSGPARHRWCTHLDVARADIDAAIACVDRFFARRR
jgi:hypothetical protein